DAGGVERPADDVVADAGEVAHASPPHEDDRVLLEVVPLARDVGRDLLVVRQAHAGDLPQGAVRLLRGHRLDLEADPALLRTGLEDGGLRAAADRPASPADELVDRGHGERARILGAGRDGVDAAHAVAAAGIASEGPGTSGVPSGPNSIFFLTLVR